MLKVMGPKEAFSNYGVKMNQNRNYKNESGI